MKMQTCQLSIGLGGSDNAADAQGAASSRIPEDEDAEPTAGAVDDPAEPDVAVDEVLGLTEHCLPCV